MAVSRTQLKKQRDLLDVPVVGRFLRWKHARTCLQAVMLAVSALILYDGFWGPQLAPKNLAGVLPWVHWRGFVVLALLIAGNLFCMACPFMLPRRLAKKLLPANRQWPTFMRSKWLAIGVLLVFFWAYEAFDLWASPWLTAWVALTYFVAAFAIDGIFRGAAFCKYVCPIGQFHFVHSMVSPLEVKVRQPDLCGSCTTKDCIKGRYGPKQAQRVLRHSGESRHPGDMPQPFPSPGRPQLRHFRESGNPSDENRSLLAEPLPAPLTPHPGQDAPVTPPGLQLVQSGCELWLFQERKVGNMDCTFCLDCIQACPYDNVGIRLRAPTSEFRKLGQWHSGVGAPLTRLDLAALVVVLVFAAFVNAFGMVAPVYDLELWLAGQLGVASEPVVLGVLFVVGLVALPFALVTLAAWSSRALAAGEETVAATATRYSFALVPIGLGMWLAHYGFHFLTGALTVIPVMQSFLADFGILLLDSPRWELAAIVPASWLAPLELLLLELGMLVSLTVGYRLAREQQGTVSTAIRALLPWAALIVLLFLAGAWLMTQPMEMRGTVLG